MGVQDTHFRAGTTRVLMRVGLIPPACVVLDENGSTIGAVEGLNTTPTISHEYIIVCDELLVIGLPVDRVEDQSLTVRWWCSSTRTRVHIRVCKIPGKIDVRTGQGIMFDWRIDAEAGEAFPAASSCVVRDVAHNGQVICACATVVENVETTARTSVGNVICEDDVMQVRRGVRGLNRKTSITSTACGRFPSLNAPIAIRNFHRMIAGGSDLASIESGTFQPSDIVSRRTGYRSPFAINEVRGGIRRARGCDDHIPTIDSMIRRKPGSARRRAVVGIAAAAGYGRKEIRGCPRG